MRKLTLSSNQIILLLTIYHIAVFNIGYWTNFLDIVGAMGGIAKNLALVLTMSIFLICTLNIILQALFYPYLHRILMPVILLLSSAASYAVMTQGIYFNDEQIINIVQTNIGEAGAWINTKFIVWLMITGVIPALFYLFKIKLKSDVMWYKAIAWRVASVVISLSIIALIAVASYQSYASYFRNHKAIVHKIVPSNYLGASIKAGYNHYEQNRPFVTIGEDAKRKYPQQANKNVLIFVLGETTRAKNWGLNANAPNTTPQLAQRQDVINFSDVSSCGTATAISVPCIFSNMTRDEFKLQDARHQEGLMDVLQRAGLYTSWRENDAGCKGACDRIKHIEIEPLVDKSQCKGGLCYGTALLHKLSEEIQAMPNDGIIVLHTNGSHGPAYFERYPAELKKFTPTCDTNQLQDCSAEQLENTYNNTIVAIDDMLTKTIQLLEQTQVNSALFYVSDHGESLGENGLYLHGAPYVVAPKEQTQVPMIFWANSGFYQAKNLDAQCLDANKDKSYSHDYIFHSMLGLFDVSTREYQEKLDLFQPCRQSSS